jgi:hypothetical protein
LEDVRDVRVPLERVIVVMGGDDDEDEADNSNLDGHENMLWDDRMSDDTHASQYDSEKSSRKATSMKEERLDGDGGDEMWTTDDDDITDATSDVDMLDSMKSTKSQSEERSFSNNSSREK